MDEITSFKVEMFVVVTLTTATSSGRWGVSYQQKGESIDFSFWRQCTKMEEEEERPLDPIDFFSSFITVN